MYCKKCGKQIVDDSKFCKYCGALVDESEYSANKFDVNPGIVVSTKKEALVKIEIAKNSALKKSTAANEVIANLKMIGIAFILWFIYIIGFTIFHEKDIKPMDENSWYGESCYDPSTLSGNWMMDWQRQFAIKVLMAPDFSKRRKPKKGKIDEFLANMDFTPLKDTDYSLVIGMNEKEALDYANSIAKRKRLSDKYLKGLREEATKAAKEDKESFCETINNYRQSGYEDDLHNNMIWAATVVLCLTILGRNIIKFGNWVADNKTE